MAPGYDNPSHLGTTRTISDGCLYCHSGIVSRKDGNDEKLIVLEMAINCERCHGAGAEHATLFKTRSISADADAAGSKTETDSRIVNPRRLERMEAESICAQCHLQGDFVVDAVGQSVWDFAPGERFEDTRNTYKVDGGVETSTGDVKTFVDHFDQLWQSACYQRSETLTCITCHDPHHTKTNLTASLVQNQHCIGCHNDEACGLDHDVRVRREQNDCFRCHMQRVESEVPHTATTNHRISISREVTKPAKTLDAGEILATIRRLHSPRTPETGCRRDVMIAQAL